jgi:hypothetical protein
MFILCLALILPSCTSFPLLTSPTLKPSRTPDEGSPVLYTDNVQTKIEISPDLKITMARGGGTLKPGWTPYMVTIFGDGRVIYIEGFGAHTEGSIEKQIQRDQLQQIVAALEEANFYGFSNNPDAMYLTDTNPLSISIETDRIIHQIEDAGICSFVNIPGRFTFCDLGDTIDTILGTPW